jgi:ribA/ribD-fused uncharacterized protein
MSDSILGFFGAYRYLSNFHMAPVEMDGLEYPSTEHAYQAAKSTDAAERRKIREAPRPTEAKRLGKPGIIKHKRADWQDVSLQTMEDLVRQKFTWKKPTPGATPSTASARGRARTTWARF